MFPNQFFSPYALDEEEPPLPPSIQISPDEADETASHRASRKRSRSVDKMPASSSDEYDDGRPGPPRPRPRRQMSHDLEHKMSETTMQIKRSRIRREDYTVGWVCALSVELAAAQEMLDEEHQAFFDDDSIFTLGRIGEHNVVIACLPEGQMGTHSAAVVATRMKSTFTSIRFGLMVGIGGGVPSEEIDIRLGDVVVGVPHKFHSGVVQYDFGKATPSGFERTGALNSPPTILLNAVSEMRAHHFRGRSRLLKFASKLNRLPMFTRENAGRDILFEADYNHVRGATCDRCSNTRVVKRQSRSSGQEVMVHYGTIASGNQVIRNAIERDKVSSEFGGVFCFEMEAAGLMNNFPCLVIRGVCDYADSHKNKRWQAYAAGMSAACAKEVLSMIPTAELAKSRTTDDIITEDHRQHSNSAALKARLVDGIIEDHHRYSQFATLKGHSDWVQSVAFSPDGKLLASGSSDGTVKLWDAATGSTLQTLDGGSLEVGPVAFSPNGKLLASGSLDGVVRLWDVAAGSVKRMLKGWDAVESVAFSPDGKRLALASNDGTVELWDSKGAAVQRLRGHRYPVRAVAFSPDGKLLASGSSDRTIRLWDAAAGSALQTLKGRMGKVWSVAFSPDGKLLASGSIDRVVRLWDVEAGSMKRTLKGHWDAVESVAFSPDGKLLASGSLDGTVRLWDAAAGSALQTLNGHSDYVWSVAFSPDGKLLASGSRDGTARLWNAAAD